MGGRIASRGWRCSTRAPTPGLPERRAKKSRVVGQTIAFCRLPFCRAQGRPQEAMARPTKLG
jgi:hypothetical protein